VNRLQNSNLRAKSNRKCAAFNLVWGTIKRLGELRRWSQNGKHGDEDKNAGRKIVCSYEKGVLRKSIALVLVNRAAPFFFLLSFPIAWHYGSRYGLAPATGNFQRPRGRPLLISPLKSCMSRSFTAVTRVSNPVGNAKSFQRFTNRPFSEYSSVARFAYVSNSTYLVTNSLGENQDL
jgi:hypothetical protein